MTPGMQLRLWFRTAARTQVVGAAVAVLAVVALLVASVSRGTAPGGTDALDNPLTAGTTGAPVAGGSSGVAAGPGGGALPTAASTTAPGAPTTGGPATGTSGTSSTTGGGTTGTAGATGGTGSTGAPSFDVSRATDRGVNNCAGVKACVKLGFLIAKIGGLDQSGFALNLRGDISQVIDAYVAWQNKHGGINGRAVVAEKRTTDPIDQTDQQNACTELTQDKKVFGVIDTASLIFAVTQKCFTRDTKTPLVHSYAESEAFMDAGHGYDLTEVRSLDRIAVEWADEIGKLGFLKGGEKVGILEDNCEPSHSVVDKYLVGGIKKYHPASIKTYESDCTAASAQAQPPALQNQMCIDGVTHVLLATSFVAAQTFLQSADASPCGSGARKYKYMASDYSLLASDLFTRNFSTTQFDGSLAITNQFTGITALSPQLRFCSKILEDAGLPGLDNSYANADAVAICDYFFLFVKAATAAGPGLTRAGWAQSAQRLGRFDGAFSPRSVYAPGKTSGGELVHAMVWHADCRCYRASGPLHVGLG
jgi:ABC-type branched-subunit amino acid transport system substrate-binding protein